MTPEQQAAHEARVKSQDKFFNRNPYRRNPVKPKKRNLPKAPAESKEKKPKPTAKGYYSIDMPRRYFKNGLWAFMQKYLPRDEHGNIIFNPDPHFLQVVNDLIDYFLVIPGAKYGPEKGIFLFGPTGTGKSLIMRSFHDLFKYLGGRYTYEWAVMRKIEFDLGESKEVGFLKQFFKRSYAFDDIGFEEGLVNVYGTRVDIGTEILTTRCEMFEKNPLVRTHGTSNLIPPGFDPGDLETIEDRYGDRVASRCNKMFHFVLLEGKDNRK